MMLREARIGLSVLWQAQRSLVLRKVLPIIEPGIRLGRGVDIGPRVQMRIVSGGTITIEDGVALERDVLIHAEQGSIIIGRNGFVGRGSQVVARDRVSIGSDALIAAGCVIRDHDHRFTDQTLPIREQGHEVEAIEIGSDVWLGAHVVVTAGSNIGSGSIIGANAVVRGTIPPNSIAAGIPAKVIRQRFAK